MFTQRRALRRQKYCLYRMRHRREVIQTLGSRWSGNATHRGAIVSVGFRVPLGWSIGLGRRSEPAKRSTLLSTSPTQIGAAHHATSIGDGTVDDRSSSEHIKQTRLGTGGHLGETSVPLAEQDPRA
jgi:hypothetical protein